MIETGILPAFGIVAGLALCAVLALVHVIVLVTGNAGQFELDLVGIVLVAGTAGNIGMFAG